MLIVLNHKMNLRINEIKEYEEAIRNYDVVVMPQTPYMGLFTNGHYTLGSQCVSEYNATGGVSPEALSGLNVQYVLVGHNERRIIERETDEVILIKIRKLLEYNIVPILCIGETTKEKESGLQLKALSEQIKVIYDKVPNEKVIIAYEPLANIGTSSNININEINFITKFIKEYVKQNYNNNVEVLYGGSVNSNNANLLKDLNDVRGVVIGTASLDIKEVIKIYDILKP